MTSRMQQAADLMYHLEHVDVWLVLRDGQLNFSLGWDAHDAGTDLREQLFEAVKGGLTPAEADSWRERLREAISKGEPPGAPEPAPMGDSGRELQPVGGVLG